MIEEKKIKVINELEGLSEKILDDILLLIGESKKTTISDNESINDYLSKRGIILPLSPRKQRIRHTPIEGKGKPASEMIIEDRRWIIFILIVVF